MGHAQAPRSQLGRGGPAGIHGHRAQPHVGEAGRGARPAEPGRVAGPRLRVLLERQVPRRGHVAERAQHAVHGRLGRVIPARRERSGGQPRPHPPRLAQARGQVGQVAQAERGHHQVEAAVAERQRARVRDHRTPPPRAPARTAAPAPAPAPEQQHLQGHVGRHHRPGPGGQRRLPGDPGPGAQVKHPSACRRAARASQQGPGQLGVDRLGALGPQPRRRLIGGPHLRRHIRYGTARAACPSHQASSSS
jgi:hypothetical protein